MGRPAAAPTLGLLDLGTARIRLLQVRLLDGQMHYAGHVEQPSQGMRKGAVVALGEASAGLRQAVAELERQTGLPLERVYVSLTGAHVRGISSQAGLALTSRSREVSREDARRVLDLARGIHLPADRQTLHVVPQEFVLDHQGGIHEPVGMLASRLEAKIYAITASAAIKDNLVIAANQAGLEVEELIFAPLAAAEACLAAEQRQAGVALVDMGAGSTGMVVYQQGSLMQASVVPVGGDHFTSDIAVGLNTPLNEAERIKHAFGAVAETWDSATAIEVPNQGGDEPRLLPQARLGECIEPRAQELVGLIQRELERRGGLGAGVVVVGGGGRLPGLLDLLSRSSGLPVRIVTPEPIAGLPTALIQPEWACLVGACYYAHRLVARQQHRPSLWDKLRQRWADLAD
ncbi:MAG: cell division protein FtsA [Terriglobales bacterium]